MKMLQTLLATFLLGMSLALSAATSPGTELTNVVEVSYTVGAGATISTQAEASLVTSARALRQSSAFTRILKTGRLRM